MKSPVAVVAGAGLNGLGVVRSLGQARIPVILLADDRDDPTTRTRLADVRPVRALGGEGFVEELLALRSTLDHDPVLFLTQDKTVETIDAHRERILPHVRLAMPDPQVLYSLMNKEAFNDFAIAAGLPVPRTLPLTGDEQPGALSALRFPCIVKPSEKNAAYFQRFKKAYIVERPDEAPTIARQFREIGLGAVLQEWIPGGEDSLYFFLGYFGRNGTLAAGFSGRKILSWPPRYGGTVACVPAPEARAEIERLSSRLLGAAGFEGMAGVEFKLDRRDGTYFVIEPTVCRTDFQSEIATLNGVNLPLAQYCSELGLPLPAIGPVAQPSGWCDPTGLATLRAHGESVSALARHDLRFRDGYFRPSDPMPWVDLKTSYIRRLAAAVARRVMVQPSGHNRDEHVS